MYLLLELINHESKEKVEPIKRLASNEYKTAFKRVKVGENMEEIKKNGRFPSKVFSNEPFGCKMKRNISKLQNKELDAILHNDESQEESESDSLDMNIGKKIKQNTQGNKPNAPFIDERNFSSMSYLQDNRNISKTSSIALNSD